MRKDLIIGIVLSLSIHCGIFFGELLAPKKGPPPKIKLEEEKVIQMEMPPPPEEEPEKVEELTDEPQQNVLAPPSLVDMPSVVPVNAFTQPIQPPPPPGMTAGGSINIPVVKPGSALGRGMQVFNVADLDQPPRVKASAPVDYPYEMKRAGITGEVTVEAILDEKGNVLECRVVKSTQREFEAPALKSFQRWKFYPNKRGGKPVAVRVQQVISFSLNEDS